MYSLSVSDFKLHTMAKKRHVIDQLYFSEALLIGNYILVFFSNKHAFEEIINHFRRKYLLIL